MRRHVPLLIYGVLALAVMGPLLLPGFILTLDMVFVPHPALVDISRSSFVFYAALHWLSFVVPADVLQKVMLLAILVLSGIGAHKLLQYLAPKGDALWVWGCYFAGTLYMINPFVYSRFMAGQYAVLLGYALLPFFVRALFRFLDDPKPRSGLIVGLWATLIGMLSVHTLGLLAVVTLVTSTVAVWQKRAHTLTLRAIGKGFAVALAVWLVANLFWLVPLAQGRGSTAAAISDFTQTDRLAFATTGDSPLQVISNILQLQGFWAEATGMYNMPQDHMPLWGMLTTGLIALVIYGSTVLVTRQKVVTVALGVSALVAIAFATGFVGDVLAGIIPFFAGYREPHKFVGLLALAYAVMGGAGVVGLLRAARYPAIRHALLVVTLAIPVLITPTMIWGFGGQLVARDYPSDWYNLNQRLRQDPNGVVLFLPWHRYMVFGFAGRIIENPAASFFEKPTITSSDPEFRGVRSAPADERIAKINQLIVAPDRAQLAAELAKLDVKYIIVAKENDFTDYSYLAEQPTLRVLADTENVTLYSNEQWKER